MKRLIFIISTGLLLSACNTKKGSDMTDNATEAGNSSAKDALTYAYKASYSSDITVPSHPEYAQKVLTVWKMFESNQVESMRPYFADSVTYNTAEGLNFHGTADSLLRFAKKEMAGLDSLRFDMTVWESAHSNDKNEDWVNIWATERIYPKKGKPDTSLIQENWLIKDGKIVYFDQYKAKPSK